MNNQDRTWQSYSETLSGGTALYLCLTNDSKTLSGGTALYLCLTND